MRDERRRLLDIYLQLPNGLTLGMTKPGETKSHRSGDRFLGRRTRQFKVEPESFAARLPTASCLVAVSPGQDGGE